jgi:hypothetical protein
VSDISIVFEIAAHPNITPPMSRFCENTHTHTQVRKKKWARVLALTQSNLAPPANIQPAPISISLVGSERLAFVCMFYIEVVCNVI